MSGNTGRINEALAAGVTYAKMAAHDLRRVGRTGEAIAEFERADALEKAYFSAEHIPPAYDWHYQHNLDLLATSCEYVSRKAKAETLPKTSFAISSGSRIEEIELSKESIMRTIVFRFIAGMAVAAGLASVAAAQAAKVDLTGKWIYTVQTEAGSGTPTITLKQDGEKLTGHYNGQLGDVDVTGSVKGNDFQFGFSSDLGGNKIDVTYKGTIVNKDEVKGTLSIVGLGEGTFTGKRQ